MKHFYLHLTEVSSALSCFLRLIAESKMKLINDAQVIRVIWPATEPYFTPAVIPDLIPAYEHAINEPRKILLIRIYQVYFSRICCLFANSATKTPDSQRKQHLDVRALWR